MYTEKESHFHKLPMEVYVSILENHMKSLGFNDEQFGLREMNYNTLHSSIYLDFFYEEKPDYEREVYTYTINHSGSIYLNDKFLEKESSELKSKLLDYVGIQFAKDYLI